MNKNYTYLKPHIYFDEQLLINRIIEDKSNDKWLIFKNNIEKGKALQNKLLKNNIDAVLIYNSCVWENSKQELKSISTNKKFKCKVLLITPSFSNNIIFEDKKIKNIVFDVWNLKTILLQYINQINFQNSNNDICSINLYLRRKHKQQIHGKIHDLKQKIEQIELLKDDPEEFKKKYNRNLSNLPKYIYLDEDNNFKYDEYDEISYYNLQQELSDLERMKSSYRKNVYTDRCLISLGLKDAEVIDLDEIQENQNIDELEQYLNSILNKPLYKKERQELILKLNIRDNRNRELKSIGKIREYLENNYDITIKSQRIRINGKQIRVWVLK